MHISPAQELMLAARRLETLKAKNLQFLGIGPGQMQAIITIIAEPGICQSQLARQMRVDKSTVNRIVNKLIIAQLVKKSPSPTDARVQGLIPTNLAKVSQKFFVEEMPYLDMIVTYQFSPQEQAQFNNLLRRTSATIQHVLDLPHNEVFPPHFDIPIPK